MEHTALRPVSDELSDNHHVRGRTLPNSLGCVRSQNRRGALVNAVPLLLRDEGVV
jgi:hypothetical protein